MKKAASAELASSDLNLSFLSIEIYPETVRLIFYVALVLMCKCASHCAVYKQGIFILAVISEDA